MAARRGGAGLVGRSDRRLRGRSGLGAAAPRRLGRRPARIRPAAADEFGLPRGAIVAAGGGDAAVGAVGLGAIAPGEAFISLGTATQLIVATDRYLSAPEKLVHSFAHALPDRWYAMAAMLNGAGALAFAGRLLGASPEALEREAAEGYCGPGALLFLPYLSGERTPLDDPYARGVLFGLSETTSRADVARAVMEGVALTLADARDCLAAAGASIERVGLIGGGAKSGAVDADDRRGDRLHRRAHAGRRNRPRVRRRAPRPDGRDRRTGGDRLPAARNRRRHRARPEARRDVRRPARTASRRSTARLKEEFRRPAPRMGNPARVARRPFP